ncbi:MAG TPA: aminotransferase class V-fold PLP-dependent enzyme, partial [Candidatus Thermoplasmatota archaeon]|nr:aminotransferase class V-fold PLP-dependent enzyme [Candidatus Thermoplasmatota archaeon]
MDWSQEFPGLARTTYLNSCAHGLLPVRTRRAVEAHLQRWTEEPDWDAWGQEVERARRAFARLIHAAPDEVAVHANASGGIAAVMGAFQPGARREVLTLDLDFPAAPALAERQRERGMAHRHVRVPGGRILADEWRRHLSPETALACVPAVASFNGYRLDLPAFVRAAHDAGAPVLVDAFQALGTFDINVKEIDIDFLVSGVYKWLLGPPGIAFLYVKREHHGRVPLTASWQAAAEPYAFDPLGPLAPDARRYQSGGASVAGAVGAAASLDLIHEVGLSAIERRNARLVARIQEEAEARKLEVLTPPERASIVTFRVPDLARALAACAREKVVVNPRLGGIRVSPHFYNGERDV